MKFVFNPLTGTFETKACGGQGSSGPTLIFGTEDGTPTGLAHVFVNTLYQQILAGKDRTDTITYADFGTKDQRITQIVYSSPSISASTAIKTVNYVLDSGRYRRTSIVRSIVP